MLLRINISPKEKEIILSHHKDEAKRLRAEIAELQGILSDVERRIHELSGEQIGDASLFDEYNTDWALWKKCEYALNANHQVCNTREIAEYIFKQDVTFTLDEEAHIKNLVKNIGATLKQKVDKNEVFERFLYPNSDIYYGLKSWKENGYMPQKYIERVL